MSLSGVENMAALQLLTLGGYVGMLPQEILMILGVLRRILVQSEAYREACTQSFLRRGSSSKSSLLAELLEHWKPSPSARVHTYF